MSYYHIGIIDNFDKEFDYSYSDLDLEYEDIIKKHNCISVNEDFFDKVIKIKWKTLILIFKVTEIKVNTLTLVV